ncbi:hypothetical protein NDU88_002984 [Pleurodeles waltl]|uniref:Uncharacterized protein n=1 Tax=Pleurodeles waltl TaxID=8319 RepID=A0AAV7M3Z3_PLEWA|nr:hypothetical protein NDU88_002984 [Pleurodeles waltl]
MAELRSGFKATDARFDTLVKHLDRMGEHLDRQDPRMEEAEEYISTLEDRATKVEKRVAKLESRLRTFAIKNEDLLMRRRWQRELPSCSAAEGCEAEGGRAR